MLSCVSPLIFVLVKKFFNSWDRRMDGVIGQQNLVTSFGKMRHKNKQKPGCVSKAQPQPKFERITVDGDLLRYSSDGTEMLGVYLAAQPLSPDHNYFEIEIPEPDLPKSLSVGLVLGSYPLHMKPGHLADSVGYHMYVGRLANGGGKAVAFGPKVKPGDRIGCGIRFEKGSLESSDGSFVPIFFTRNGKEIGTTLVRLRPDGLYPSVAMFSGDEVRITLNMKWTMDEEMHMAIDSHEDDWIRLHDIRLNGQVLEYTGRGKSIGDVGLAQARWPLNTCSHYFELEIVDPGDSCYIAIGLARRDYPKYRHPGWNKGSIAYHADDGKMFNGSGVGDAFGPKCHKGDVMGCGIIFPRDFSCNYDSDGYNELNSPQSPVNNLEDGANEYEGSQSESEDEIWWNEHNKFEGGPKVQVFFTRNGKTLGQKEMCIPKGGFFPTIGMLSLEEKVKVDLKPLSG